MTDMTHPHIASALRTLDIESSAIARLKSFLDTNFVQAVELFCKSQGRIIVTGMGKSGHVGKKLAATFSSTGTPSFFVHPAEASHGDLGMITKEDVLLAISNSGEVDELTAILPHVRRMNVPVVALTGNTRSTLAMQADLVISTHVQVEACPMNLAPTASTSAQLAMGDALAIACLENRGFQAADFAASHPGGALGRKLLTRVSDVMRTGASIPVIDPGTSFLDMMARMSSSGLGLAITVDSQQVPHGIFTDGDLRRELCAGSDLIGRSIASVMRKNPVTILENDLAVDAAAIMEEKKVTSILAVNSKGQLTGVINTNDLLRAKVI